MEAGWNLRGLCPSCCRVPLYLFLISPQLHSLFIWNLHERRFFLRPHFNIVIERSVGRVSVIWFVIYRYVVSAVTFDRSLMLTRSSVSVCDTLSVFYCVFFVRISALFCFSMKLFRFGMHQGCPVWWCWYCIAFLISCFCVLCIFSITMFRVWSDENDIYCSPWHEIWQLFNVILCKC